MIRTITPKIYAKIKYHKTISKLNEIEKTQWYSYDKIKKNQWEKVKKIIKYAYKETDFYRERLDEVNIKPEDISSPKDLLRVPSLTREDLNKNREKMISKSYDKKKLYKNYTGGSTGKPVILYLTKEKREISHAIKMRYYKWYGCDIGDPIARLWGAERDIGKNIGTFRRIFNDYCLNHLNINTFDLTEKKINAYNEKIKNFKPKIIGSYVSSAYLFSKIIKKNNLNPPEIKSMFVTAETLHEFQRSLIESSFRCPVFNIYGSREFGDMVSECPEQRKLHINSENVYIEFIKNGKHCKPGETGEIFVTDLVNYGMPILRYQIGDIGEPSYERCKCGRGLPLIKNIKGRVTDNFIRSDGGFVHGEFFTHLFYNKNGIEQFQIIQESKNLIIIKIKKSGEINKKTIKHIEKFILRAMGNIDVKFIFVDKIIPNATGKYRFTISKVPLEI